MGRDGVGHNCRRKRQDQNEESFSSRFSCSPEELFRRSELLRSQRALYESNLFKRAAIEIPRQGDSSKVVVVTVTEAPLREARLSAGFNTIDFFQVEGRFTHYNFLGRSPPPRHDGRGWKPLRQHAERPVHFPRVFD